MEKLPDELWLCVFIYLHNFDILYSFNSLNLRFQKLIGSYESYINLSDLSYKLFNNQRNITSYFYDYHIILQHNHNLCVNCISSNVSKWITNVNDSSVGINRSISSLLSKNWNPKRQRDHYISWEHSMRMAIWLCKRWQMRWTLHRIHLWVVFVWRVPRSRAIARERDDERLESHCGRQPGTSSGYDSRWTFDWQRRTQVPDHYRVLHNSRF